MSDDDWAQEHVGELLEAEREAGELLHFLALRFIVLRKDNNQTLNLLGLQMALIKDAARMALIQKDVVGGRHTKATFGKMAREMYEDVSKYRAKNRPTPPPKKPTKLKLVK